jgi:hypothetical protein
VSTEYQRVALPIAFSVGHTLEKLFDIDIPKPKNVAVILQLDLSRWIDWFFWIPVKAQRNRRAGL